MEEKDVEATRLTATVQKYKHGQGCEGRRRALPRLWQEELELESLPLERHKLPATLTEFGRTEWVASLAGQGEDWQQEHEMRQHEEHMC